LANKLKEILTGIQYKTLDDPFQWTRSIG
jgi:hypothetical protein